MKYISTRNSKCRVSAAQAITQGISVEGGLFLPEALPQVSMPELQAMTFWSYHQRAEKILSLFLEDFSLDEIQDAVAGAYNTAFPEGIAPVVKVGDTFALELWHGPTSAFKDMALQILPYLLTAAAKKTADGKEIVILVATSGDTGKAALEGFHDVDGTQIMVFYPRGGVSKIQYLQMATQLGDNVKVFAVEGNFDDTQTGVKKIFTNPEIAALLERNNKMFSSANSINWGRLLPQIVYYFSSYLDLVKTGEITCGDRVNYCVPTGNFGNILAAYYAKQMGLPVGKLICASNENKVLTDFINTGIYDRRREFVLTNSPSMDILISSNLERLLYALYQDSSAVAGLLSQLEEDGIYQVAPQVLEALQKDFYAGFCDQQATNRRIEAIFRQHGYLADTHTAVAFDVYEQYRAATGDNTKTVIVSTANPYKFAGSILKALEPDNQETDEFLQVQRLFEQTKLPVPEGIKRLELQEIRFSACLEKDRMAEAVQQSLNLDS